MKEWINNNLIYSRGLICKKCKRDWFEKYNFLKEYQKILDVTRFLDDITPTLPQRIWHILNGKFEKYKCQNPNCNNTTSFFAFTKGYLRTCCPSCAQFDSQTINKIKVTNLKRYGVEYGLQNEEIKKKSSESILKKYGTNNVSQCNVIKEKKKNTCFKNYGVNYYLQSNIGMTQYKTSILEKYGVDNIQKNENIKLKTIKTRRGEFYESLFNTNRLYNLATPLFSKDEYVSGGLYGDYSFKCKKCNKIFLDCLEDGDLPRCPDCFRGRSWFQKEVVDYITSILPNDIVEENCKTIFNNKKELDVYIPTLKIGIECDGLYWHGETNGGKDKKYHLNKTEECEKIGIRLIHIFEDEWLYNQNIIKKKLLHIFKKETERIYARNCEIKIISGGICNKFLDLYHLQGTDNSSIRLGIYSNDTLAGVMTFGCLRKSLGNVATIGEYEMYRFCLSKNIIGAGSKLLSHFIKIYNPSKIISYADKRWSDGSSFYSKIGFNFIKNTVPNYWYFRRGKEYKRHHRFAFAKHTLSKKLKNFNPTLTEWENMKNNGYDRIWDCGNLKYEWIK